MNYTIEGKEFNGQTFYTVKPVMQQQAFGGGKPYQKDPETEKRITRMSVLKVAGDLVINEKIKLHDLTKVAQIFERYVMTGEDSMSAIYAAANPKTNGIAKQFQEEAIKNMDMGGDDLPF